MKEGNPKAIYLKDYHQPDYLINKVDLCFELFDEKTLVHAELHIHSNQSASNKKHLVLHGEQLKLIHVKIDDNQLSDQEFSVSPEELTIQNVPDQFVLSTLVEIDPAQNTALEGLYLSSGNYCTQCEAEGFRKITYYLDRPDVMAIFSVRIEADQSKIPVMLSNGNRISEGKLDNGRHFAQWHDPYPKPSYLFALVAGDLSCCSDEFTTKSGRNVSLEIYTESHNADKCDHAIASLKKAMQWDESTFNLEYDLDTYMIVAVDDFNMGAMENKGLNVFNSKCVLASPKTSTDADYMSIEAVIAHEYFHNWTGNRVTCRDWFQLSLKEGLTVFRDQEFTSDVTSRAVKRIQDVRYLRTYQFAEDDSPMAHPIRPSSYVEINNFYTLTVYEKGSEVVRMYQTLLGRDGFKKGLQRYFKKHDGQAVTTDDFAAAMAEANDFELGNFLNWYSQSGTPAINVSSVWDQDKQEYVVTFEQELPTNKMQSKPQPYLVPINTALYDANGKSMVLNVDGYTQSEMLTLRVSQTHQEIVFAGITEKPTPSFLQNFSAPVKLNFQYTAEDFVFLMANDTDTFNRWDAGQRFATEWLLDAIIAVKTDIKLPDAAQYIAALEVVLRDESIDSAFKAEMMVLPQESYLADFIQPIDVDAIYQARKQLQVNIATSLEKLLLDIYRQNSVSGDYQYNATDMGKRRLASICLSYLNSLEKYDYIQLSKAQFENTDNMTDSMAALEAVNDLNEPFRDEALAVFGERWKQDALVMDKWFSLQARSRKPGVLETIKKLLDHPSFSIKNPNKVRALISVFAMANPTAFHAKDGSGYTFLADKIIELNTINPQVASRLVKPLIDWKKYDVVRQDLMKQSLQRIKAVPDLSRDVFEIVDRGLEN
ncbi:MAG: aminopeptidase N [Gammaproteobacteria bacterium]|nr:aminopeptidase N [Gammaproteobacteria bacterium]